jgi:hypothetical protein
MADVYLLFEIESKCHRVIASAAKQSIFLWVEAWIASLRSQ